jgi:hypothetical protein
MIAKYSVLVHLHCLPGPDGFVPLHVIQQEHLFFILYHYESNSILVAPITGLNDMTIFNNYKQQFELLLAKGFMPKFNVMDNQTTKDIKTFLIKIICKLQLVEPHNHRINSAERAVHMFKDAFIAALATTDSDFPLQLWDTLTPQIQDTLNLMHAPCIDSLKLSYEILNGPYDGNRYP